MDEKRKIILSEIESWKKNKVLPQQYCDFLTALYTEGSENYSTNSYNGSASSKMKKYLPYFLFTISLILAVGFVILLGYYFNDFSQQLQIALLCIFLFVAGIFLKWFYVQFLALLSLICLLAWNSLPYLEEHFSWALFEGSWLGAGLMLLFTAWFVRQMHIQLSLNLFIHGLLLLFVPVIQGMFLEAVPKDILQLILFSKLIFVALFLFVSRRILDVYVKVFSS